MTWFEWVLVVYVLLLLWFLADGWVTAWTEAGSDTRFSRSPYRVACPRCGVPALQPCRGMRYETHVARDREATGAVFHQVPAAVGEGPRTDTVAP